MRVLAVIPAYNEEENILRVVEELKQKCPAFDYVVINDGSSDNTLQILKDNHLNYIDQPVNLGLAGTFQTGMKYAKLKDYDAVVQFDGDGQHRPEYISAMADKLAEGYNIVIGSRFIDRKKPHSMRMLGSNMIALFMRMTTGRKIADPTSGMRMFDRRIIRILANSRNMGPEPDTVAYLMRCGAKVTEVPVTMRERIAGQSYLTLSRSIQYMANVCTSILLIGWFREKVEINSL